MKVQQQVSQPVSNYCIFNLRPLGLRKLSVPTHKTYSSSNGYLRNPDGQLINGVTVKSGKTISVYFSKSAFRSSGQLYMTMHHEYMHAYFYVNNLAVNHHEIINGWHKAQVQVWKSTPNFSRDLFNNQYWNYSTNTAYKKYGLNLINYLP